MTNHLFNKWAKESLVSWAIFLMDCMRFMPVCVKYSVYFPFGFFLLSSFTFSSIGICCYVFYESSIGMWLFMASILLCMVYLEYIRKLRQAVIFWLGETRFFELRTEILRAYKIQSKEWY